MNVIIICKHTILLLIAPILLSVQLLAQSAFKEITCKDGYRIVLQGDKFVPIACNSLGYRTAIFEDYTDDEKLILIEELLTYKGDQRLSQLSIKCYEGMLCEPIKLPTTRYSLQLEALFLINQLYFKKPFFYAPMPFLLNIESGEIESISGEHITDAFDCYRQWFNEVKTIGLKKARRKKMLPLPKDGEIQWSSKRMIELAF